MLKNGQIPRRKNCIEAYYKLFLILLILNLIAIPLISAASYDNIKSFDKNIGDYGKVTIRDWFGLRSLAELTLTKNSDVCNVNCSAEKEIILYQSTPLIDDVRFLIKQRNGDWEEGEIENYYFQIVNGDSTISYEPGIVMPAGTYTLRLIGKKDMFETVDWQVTSQGRLLDEWAQWTSSLNNGLMHYWDLDENTGTNIEDIGNKGALQVNGTITDAGDLLWDTGILGSAVNFTGDGDAINMSQDTDIDKQLNGTAPFSFSFWVYIGTLRTNQAMIGKGMNAPNGFFYIGQGVSTKEKLNLFIEDENAGRFHVRTTKSELAADKRWIHIVVTNNGTTNNETGTKMYINGTSYEVFTETSNFDPAVGNLNDEELTFGWALNPQTYTGIMDEVGMWNRTLTPSEVSTLYSSHSPPTYSGLITTLNAPVDNYESVNRSITFNCSAIDLTEVSNITLWINGSANYTQTGSATTFLELYQTITTEDLKYQNWTCKSTNSVNEINFATNRTFNIVDVATRGETHDATAYETSLQNFSLEIQTKENIKSISGKLWYDNLPYDADITSYASDVYNLTKSLELPLASTASQNKSFNWEISLTLSDDSTTKTNSSTYGQIVEQTLLILCNATYDATMINFTSKYATNPYPNVNATFKVSWGWYVNGSSGLATRNDSYEDLTEGNQTWGFCMKPQHENFIVDATIEYDGNDLAKNYYFLNDALLNNQTQNISIYLLNDSLATLTVLKVQDGAQKPLENVSIQIQAYDVGTDTYYTTAMGRTAFNGEDLAYLNWYDTLYKFILTQNGEVIKITSPYKISETPQIFEVLTEVTFPYDKFRDFLYTLTYNSVTKNFILTFTKPSGLVDSGCLRVIKRSIRNDTTICDVCETSSSATLYCNINGYGNGTYVATFYATGSLFFVETIVEFVGEVNEMYGLIGNVDGTIYAFFFAGIVLAMFFVSPALGVIGTILGVLGAMVMGFQPLNYLEFAGIIIMGGIVIWLLNR